MAKKESLKILEVEIENLLCLKKVDIKPDSKLNIFFGENTEGKTDVLEAIKFALKGEGDEDIIHYDADKAMVMVDIGKYKIKRTKTRKSHTLSVTNDQGFKPTSPQTFLDVLVGSAFSFDPFAFLLLKEKELKKYILDMFEVKVTKTMLKFLDKGTMELLDLKKDGFTVLQDAEKILYVKRTEINKQAKQKEALLEEKKGQCETFVPDEYDPQGLQKTRAVHQGIQHELTVAEEKKIAVEEAKEMTSTLGDKIDIYKEELGKIDTSEFDNVAELENECSSLNKQIETLQDQLSKKESKIQVLFDNKKDYANLTKLLNESEETLALLPEEEDIPDIPKIEEKLEVANKQIADNEEKDRLSVIYNEAMKVIKPEFDKYSSESDEITISIDKLRNELPIQLTENSDIPIEGLSFDGDKVMIGKKALKFMSTSEKIKIALDIVRELNKDAELKILCLDRAESLDRKTLEEFKKQIEGDDYQYFVTQVQQTDEIPKDVYKVSGGTVTEPEVK